jgi:probable O-glycosylation ligase (exosortase A-associated)
MSQTTSAEWWRPSQTLEAPVDAPAVTEEHGRRPFRALLVFTVILMLAPQEMIPALAPLRLALVAGLAAVYGVLADRARRSAPWVTPPEFVIAGCLLAWTVVTIPLSVWPGGSLSRLTDLYIKALIVFWLIGHVVNTVNRSYRLAWTMSLLTAPIAIVGLLNYRAGVFVQGGSNSRIEGYGTGIASNPNDLALTLAIVLPLTLALVVTADRAWQRMVAGGIALVTVAAIVVTFSRGGFLALATIVVLGLFWLIRRRAVGIVAGMLVVAATAPVWMPAGYADRLATLSDINSDPTGSAQERLKDSIAAVHLIEEHPLVGAGLGMDILALNQVRGATWQPVHDVYLQYGVDLGLPGMLLFVALLISSIWTAWQAERAARGRDERLATIAGAVRISLMAFVVAAFFYPVAYYFYFYYLAGFAVALRITSGSSTS